MTRRRSKRGGRPRLDDTSDAILNDRRAQVRHAQRTYRLKKEAIFQNATARAERLEERIRTAAEEAARLSNVAIAAQLHVSHPEIHARLKRLDGILADYDIPIDTCSPVPAKPSSNSAKPQVPVSDGQGESPQQCPLPLPTRQCTYAFQEVSFARRLQRYCLEYAYRLFVERRSDPRGIYRVFRLVPCVRDPSKTQPRFRQLLMGENTDPLELLSLPFYRVGGAGTHFPDVDEGGNAIYPANSRMPRRVLGIFPCVEMGGNGGEDPLEIYGLGGEWFDCRDVEGYLRLNGVDVNGGLTPTLYITRKAEEGDVIRSYVLDIEGLFSRLISGLVMLGRAPGFRKIDVRRALQASVRRVRQA